MSIDPSLKTAGGLTKHRNVLSRTERIERLSDRGQFNPEEDSPLGLTKVANRKVVAGGKAARKQEEAAAAAEAEAAGEVPAPAAGGDE